MGQPLFFIEGQPATQLPLTNRGLHYGDGVFTTIAVSDGVPLLWSYHWARLNEAANVLQFRLPDEKTCHQHVCHAAHERSDCVIKLMLVRDNETQTRGYLPTLNRLPVSIIGVYGKPTYMQTHWQTGIRLAALAYRLATQPVLAGIKHLNCLDRVLAAAQLAADEPLAQEGWCCDAKGHIISGTKSNLFMIKDDSIFTPRLSECGVKGVMRAYLIACLKATSHTVIETDLCADDLHRADAIFMTNALIGVWPVRQINTHVYAISPLVRRCQAFTAPQSFCPMLYSAQS